MKTKNLQGSVARAIRVETNDPAKKVLSLTLRATVTSSVIILPHEKLYIGNARPGVENPKLLIRKDPSETGKLEISDLRLSAPWLAATVTELKEPRPASDGLPEGKPGDWLLELRLEGHPDVETRMQTLTFKTGLQRQPDVKLPIRLYFAPPVNITPNSLLFDPARDGTTETQDVYLSVRHDLDPAQITVEASPPSIDVQLEPTGRRFFKAHVRWDGLESMEGHVLFKVGGESSRLPVYRNPAAEKAVTAPAPADG